MGRTAINFVTQDREPLKCDKEKLYDNTSQNSKDKNTEKNVNSRLQDLKLQDNKLR